MRWSQEVFRCSRDNIRWFLEGVRLSWKGRLLTNRGVDRSESCIISFWKSPDQSVAGFYYSKMSDGLGKVSYGINKVFNGLANLSCGVVLSDGLRKVSYGLRKVSFPLRKLLDGL